MRKYILVREDGQALHYVGGSLFWHKTNNFDAVMDSTMFYKKKEAMEFAKQLEKLVGALLRVVAVDLTVVP
jgi:hypothetical protein